MKRVIAAAAVLLAAFGMAAQAQAHGWDNDRPGWQDRGRQERGWQDNRSYDNHQWQDRGRDRRGWQQSRQWHDRDDWRDRDDGRWSAPRYRDNDYSYPRYYSRPDYGYGSRYSYPPAYRHGSYGSYGGYSDYDDCDDGDVSFFLSLPLRF